MDSDRVLSDFRYIIEKTLGSIQGETLVAEYLTKHQLAPPKGVIAIGKAAGSMSKGAIKYFNSSDSPLDEYNSPEYLVITKRGHLDMSPDDQPDDQPDGKIDAHIQADRLIESSHPIPDESSLYAGKKLLESCEQFKRNMGEDDYLLFLISGGTSALVEVLSPGTSLRDMMDLNNSLLNSAQSISQINKKRKEISQIKNGKLADYLAPCKVQALYLSDVPTNDPAIIGSGLLANSPNNVKGNVKGNIKANVKHHILADNLTARKTAKKWGQELGYESRVHSKLFEGHIDDVAEEILKSLSSDKGTLHVWGGEPIIDLPDNPGIGGRNQHLALVMAKHIRDHKMDCVFASVGTDGNDGLSDYAGALVDSKMDIPDINKAIAAASSTASLEKVKASLKTGASGSNLMDIMIGYAW